MCSYQPHTYTTHIQQTGNWAPDGTHQHTSFLDCTDSPFIVKQAAKWSVKRAFKINVPLEPKLLHGNVAFFTADPILSNSSRKNRWWVVGGKSQERAGGHYCRHSQSAAMQNIMTKIIINKSVLKCDQTRRTHLVSWIWKEEDKRGVVAVATGKSE